MKAEDPDPIKRWQTIADWYAEFAVMRGWEFLSPMVDLTMWIGAQPFAGQLFPSTSYEWLCVDLLPGYNPDKPFFSCVSTPDGKFECHLFSRVAHSLCREECPLEWNQRLFASFVEQLLQVGSPESAS